MELINSVWIGQDVSMEKLNQGEIVFGEIAGFFAPNSPIMSRGDNKKTQDKEFIRKFNTFLCNEEEGLVYHRMTIPLLSVIEYPWDLVKLRAEQMGFETVPELDRFIYTTEEDFIDRINKWMDIPSTIDATHIIEGVVVRALNAPTLQWRKKKSYNFKVIEGIIKDAEAPDIEEAEEVTFEESIESNVMIKECVLVEMKELQRLVADSIEMDALMVGLVAPILGKY